MAYSLIDHSPQKLSNFVRIVYNPRRCKAETHWQGPCVTNVRFDSAVLGC
jgi:hypothetical protein